MFLQSLVFKFVIAVFMIQSLVFAQNSSESEPPQETNSGRSVLGVFSILFGFIFVFLGFKWKGLVFFWSATSLFALIANVILWNVWPTCTDFLFVLIPLIFGFSGGIIGYFANPVGRASLGAIAGISFSMWIFSIRPVALLENELFLNLVLSGITLVFAFSTYYKEFPDDKYPIILASSFSGAYGVCWGFDVFFETGLRTVFNAVLKGNYKTLPVSTVDSSLGVVLGLVWILFIIGGISQMIRHRGVDIKSMPLQELSTHEEKKLVII